MDSKSYFEADGVNNSTLTEIKEQLITGEDDWDPVHVFAMGSLVDAMITEPDRVDYFEYSLEGEEYDYSPEQFDQALKMVKAFEGDDFCQRILSISNAQKVMFKEREFTYGNFRFRLLCKCKWDLFIEPVNWGGDIKTTSATSLKGFDSAIDYFDYDRQRAWYMDIAGSDKDVLIGLSRCGKVFKRYMKRGDERHKRGQEKYRELAFQYWKLYK